MASTTAPTAADVQESLRQVERAQVEKQAAVDHRRNLHRQMTALLKQITPASDEATDKTMELNCAAEEHDRIARLHLCINMHAKLPRELRDLIYDHVHGPNYYETVKKRTDMDSSTCEPDEVAFTFRNSRLKDDFKYSHHPSLWWDDAHISRPVATELVQRWYQIRTFVFSSKHLYLLPSFLAHDIFNKDLEPGALINRLRCNVAVVRNRDAASKLRQLNGLRHLGEVRNKRVELVLRLFCPRRMGEGEKKEVIRGILETLRPLVKEWREGGFERVAVWNASPNQELSGLFEGDEEEYEGKLKLLGLGEENEEGESN